MRPRMNLELLEQTTFDSSEPSGAAAVVHRFDVEGRYVVELARADEVVDVQDLVVRPVPAHATGGSPGERRLARSDVVTVTLHRSEQVDAPPPPALEISAGGYAMFSERPGRSYRAVVRRVAPGTGEQSVEFDSARLGPGDIFALTLVRPGRYAMRSSPDGHEGSVVVTFPVVGDVPYRPEPPATVECGAAGLTPDSVTLGPGQGIIFRIATESRIVVELVEPDDGPQPPAARPAASWRKSRPDEDPGRAR